LKFFRERIIRFLPLLLLYVILVILFSSDLFHDDEGAYVRLANHIAGLSTPDEPVSLLFGPGYPIVLLPFVTLQIPWLGATLLNAVFLFGAVVYFYSTLILWIPEKYGTIICYLFGIYPPLMREIHLMHSEGLVFFLICGIMYHFCMLSRKSDKRRIHFFITALFLGYLALTKVFFVYVFIVMVTIYGILYLWKRIENFKQVTLIYLFALLLCVPNLIYTYSVTGKAFYLGTSGGFLLYWMSSPYQNELGSAFHSNSVQKQPYLAHHKDFFDKLSYLSEVEKDVEFKKQAIFNITHYPARYIVNWTANVGRMLFSYPFSCTQQKLTTYFFLLPNMFLVVLTFLSIYPAFRRWASIQIEIITLFIFVLVAFGGVSLGSAINRYIAPLTPIIILWLSFIYLRVLKIELLPESEIWFPEEISECNFLAGTRNMNNKYK